MSELVKADFGPYASRIYKFMLFNEENFMDNPLKFIHINNDNLIKGPGLSNKEKRKNRSRTVAVLSLSPHAIRKAVSEYLNNTSDQAITIPMVVGIQVVSLEDNYSKKIGRDLSVGQMKELDLEIKNVRIEGDTVSVKLETYENVTLSLRLNKKTGFSTVYGRLNPY